MGILKNLLVPAVTMLMFLAQAEKIGLQFEVRGAAAGIRPAAVTQKGMNISLSTDKQRLFVRTPQTIGDQWVPVAFEFTPDIGGDVALLRFAQSSGKGNEWAEFRNFKVTGATVKIHMEAPVNRYEGIERGTNNAPLYDILRVQGGQKVRIGMEARNGAGTGKIRKYPQQAWWVKQPELTAAWHDKLYALLGADSLGQVRAIYNKFARESDHDYRLFVTPQGKISNEKFVIPLELLEENGVARNALIRAGVPFPEKSLYALDGLTVRNAQGNEIPAQFYAIGFWPDKSVKWALTEFVAPLKANEKTTYTVETGKSLELNAKPVISAASNSYTVNTGRVTAETDSQLLLKNITVDGKKIGSLALTSGNSGVAKILKTSIEEQGPVSATLRIDGDLVGDTRIGSFVARLRFVSGSPAVGIALTYRADNMCYELTELDSFVLRLNAGKGTILNNKKEIFQGSDLVFNVDKAQHSGFMPDSVNFNFAGGTITAGIADAGKRYPKAFTATEEGLHIGLLPPLPDKKFNSDLPGYLRYPFCEGKYRMMAGTNFTEEVTIDFSGAPVVMQEVIAVIPSAWYARTKALRGADPQGPAKEFDQAALNGVQLHLGLKAKQREYGFLNYGDWFGERGGNWGNNEYDFSWGLLNLFARTGNRDVCRFGLTAARHTANVDIIHATAFKEFYGANYMHCIGHTVGCRLEPGDKTGTPWYNSVQGYAAANNGHSWCGGMWLAFMMSGKADIGTGAAMLSDAMAKRALKPYTKSQNVRSHGWLLEGVMQAYDATGEKRYLDAATCAADELFNAQLDRNGTAWASKLIGAYEHGYGPVDGGACFQIGVTVQALHHYLQRVNRPDKEKQLALAAQWLRQCWNESCCGWPYTASKTARPLWRSSMALNLLIAPGANADDSAEGRHVVRTVLKLSAMLGPGANGIGKDLAYNLVFAPVLYEMAAKDPQFASCTDEKFFAERAALPKALKLRGPEDKVIEIRLLKDEATLKLASDFYYRRPGTGENFTVTLLAPDGKVVETFSKPVRTRDFAHEWKIRGKAGDVFTLKIHDEYACFWEADAGKDAQIRVKIQGNAQFGNGCPLFFKVRVPAGVKNFEIVSYSTHPAFYGLMLADPNGRIVDSSRQYNFTTCMPWMKDKKPDNKVSVKAERADASKEEFYGLYSWCGGDVVFKINGIPAYFEYSRQ